MDRETRFKCRASNNSAEQTKSDVYTFSANRLDSNSEINKAIASTDNSAVHFIPVYIDETNIIKEIKEILSIIRPQWNINAVKFKKFTDGITNKLIGCFLTQNSSNVIDNKRKINESNSLDNNTFTQEEDIEEIEHSEWFEDNNDSGNLSDDDSSFKSASYESNMTDCVSNVVLIRIYGNKTSMLIDRQAEVRNIKLLKSYGFAPSLYATFKNGLAYEFVPGVTLNPRNVLRTEIWILVARRMAEMHRIVKPISSTDENKPVPMLWSKTQKFLDIIPERFTDAEKHKRLADTFLPIKKLRVEFANLYKRLEALNSPLVFAHNDLLLRNVIYTESVPRVTFIDYEYADYNFQAFDIGNHFAEYAGVDNVDYARYPGKEFQYEWLGIYLQTYLNRANVTEAEVYRLYVQVNQFALASHFFWTIWSLIQAEHSTINFDYVEYAFIRYNEFLAKKEVFLALDEDYKR